MALQEWIASSLHQPGAPGLRALLVSRGQWRRIAEDMAATGARVGPLWTNSTEDTGPLVHAAYLMEDAGLVLALPLAAPDNPYPGIEDLFPAAARMQRAITDLSGLSSTATDSRPWLSHAAWPRTYRPLVDPPMSQLPTEPTVNTYDFVRVDGDGVHEIAVGPVHAGTIEPGHFRFSVVGEKVLKLEERLGYVHKGIEQRFTQLPIHQGHRLAARVCGDSTVAFSWAYCQAFEGIANSEIPLRAAWLRALYLELERVANHLGDLGALGNDAGFAFGLMQFGRLKESLLRSNQDSLGQRYLMDAIVPGGTAGDLTRPGVESLSGCIRAIQREAASLRTIYDEHAGLRDRFAGAGTVPPELAAGLGLTGLAGRASGQAFDLRADMPCEFYREVPVKKVVRSEGDVAARVAVRFDELQESCHLIQYILGMLPKGAHRTPVRVPDEDALGVGLIEGWRGPVWVALQAGPAGTIRRCHPHDPSWQNWPVLEHAIIGNIVPDFPLINKSFNLSYSGQDL